jgi:LmbE family N-acetylglucosaminyl deacetylase
MATRTPIKVAIAIGAHPDDIEFYMAGTLLLLKQDGFETHYLTLASGNCGSSQYNAGRLRSIRQKEARASAGILGAHFHPSLTDDLEILYQLELLRKIAAILREVQPTVILTHSPQDYMEDHTNTCRLVVTAAFARGMANFKTMPSRPVTETEVTLYHAMPHGLRDALRCRIIPGAFVNTTAVYNIKQRALGCHQSQQNWLQKSQGLNSYLRAMEEMSVEVGKMSKRFKHAEGWRRHLHLGFCTADADLLATCLGKDFLLNKAYEQNLEKGS